MSFFSNLLPGVPVVESPIFQLILPELSLDPEELRIAQDLNRQGYAVFDFPDIDFGDRGERIIGSFSKKFDLEEWSKSGWGSNIGLRIQDAWQYNDDVKAIASNSWVLTLLSKLYGRRAFPFQTLNFPVGTQQHFHSDAIHFSSVPERFMCGVWVALEDIRADAGPLVYYPTSHKWPVIYNDMLQRRVGSTRNKAAQEPYEPVWRAMIESAGVEPEIFLARKGQALIWAANLLHGGSKQRDPTLTRWSQVTHYYFENCSYFTPAFSDPLIGNLDLRDIRDIESGESIPNLYIDKPISDLISRMPQPPGSDAAEVVVLPDDFDPERYYELNPDVKASGFDPATHYLVYGSKEGRRTR